MKSETLVIQSHRSPLPHRWLDHCLQSVRYWTQLNQYDYRFIGDELFASVPRDIQYKTRSQVVIATDLARLFQLQKYLHQGYKRVIWCDADFLIFNPEAFVVPDEPFAVGREHWIQPDKNDKLKCYTKVHNAFLMFQQDNSFLDFYADTALRLLSLNTGRMPPQFIGPKLLTALHNIVICPVMETAGMLSPDVIKDLSHGGGAALDLFKNHSIHPVSAVNLSASLAQNNELNSATMEAVIQFLLHQRQL